MLIQRRKCNRAARSRAGHRSPAPPFPRYLPSIAYVIFAEPSLVTARTAFSVTGLREGVQQRIGAHEAQADAQRREEVRVHDVRQGVQAARSLVSTDPRVSPRPIDRSFRNAKISIFAERCFLN